MQLTLGLLLLVGVARADQRVFKAGRTEIGHRVRNLPVDISGYFNNRGSRTAASSWPLPEGEGQRGWKEGRYFAGEYLPESKWSNEGVEFELPQKWGIDDVDNIRVDQQHISFPPEPVLQIHLLAAGEDPGGFLKGDTTEDFPLTFADGASTLVSVEVKNWWGLHWTNKGPIRAPYNYLPDGSLDYNVTHLFHITIPVPPQFTSLPLSSISLPAAAEINALHIFALTLTPATTIGDGSPKTSLADKVQVKSVRATRRWEDVDGHRAQIVEVALINPFPAEAYTQAKRGWDQWLDEDVLVRLQGKGIETTGHAKIRRMMSGDEVKLEIGVKPTSKSAQWDDVKVVLSGREETVEVQVDMQGSKVVHDWHAWGDDMESMEEHSAPKWFSGGKFGVSLSTPELIGQIFIHWGLFAVPAWTDKHKYAEWYNWWLHDEGAQGGTYKHHLENYGADFVYDDFIPMFKPDSFNASAWVELFADAGAKYFVLTTKHHDGFALFDTGKTSNRNSLKLGPKRDFLRELMDAAKKEQPGLRRGTYFSMPEWFNPLYQKYGKVMFPGGVAHSPFHPEQVEEYTGFIDHDDFLEDVQLAQMKILAEEYETEVMWCDIGLSNHTSAFAPQWYSQASKANRQVVMNDRCGVGGDFNTPEMTKLHSVQRIQWESNVGIDPYSYGYNQATKDDEYRNASNIIQNLVDISAKGGNYLLNVGPDKHGVIIPAMANPLREAGRWLKTHGKAVYDTDTFPLVPQITTDEIDVRITRTPEALYIISFKPPTTPIWTLPGVLPIMPSDEIVMLGEENTVVNWTPYDGSVTLYMDEHMVSKHGAGIAWVFEIRYRHATRQSADPSQASPKIEDEL